MRVQAEITANVEDSAPLDTATVYAAHAGFVWNTLHRLGVPAVDLDDMLHEVFVIVHQKLDTYDGRAKVTTWLFGICLRATAGYRRRAFRHRERPLEPVDTATVAHEGADPEQRAVDREAEALLRRVLDEMSLDKRAVFVMFEIERMSCPEIAELVGVPLGTVFSRLAAARQAFAESLARHTRPRGGKAGR